MRNRIFFKLLAAFLLVSLAATLTLDYSIHHAWEQSFRREIVRNLQQKTRMFAYRVNTDRQTQLHDVAAQEGQAAGARATIIDIKGNVLADSEFAPSSVENPSQQPEFVAALQGDLGTDIRRSDGIGVPFVFVAAPISGGAVRLAYPLSDVPAAAAQARHTFWIGLAVALVISLLLAGLLAQLVSRRLLRIVNFAERLSAGDYSARLDETSLDEIGSVAGSLDKAARHIEESLAALKTSRQQLETVLNSMQDAVVALGPDLRVLWANQMMDRIVPQKTRLNAPVVETVRDPDFLNAVRSASTARNVITVRAVSIIPGRTFDVTAAPMPGGGTVAVVRDLTETERVEKTRRDFIANVSHELRTPLTSIQGYTETLLDGLTGNDHSREFLDIIRKNATRMSRLTEDLLTLARVESGEHRFDLQPVNVGDLLQEAVQSFSEPARAHGVELRVEDNASAQVSADPEAIHQVFSNLVDNAIKYGGSGNLIILGARPAGQMIELFVRDSGPGIPSEHLGRLFERFYRVDKARSRESGGTGLGLAIAKHIVLAHGGTIRAESELNHGSTFVFTLPRAASAHNAAV